MKLTYLCPQPTGMAMHRRPLSMPGMMRIDPRIPPHDRMAAMGVNVLLRRQLEFQRRLQRPPLMRFANFALQLHHFLTHLVPSKGVEHIISWVRVSDTTNSSTGGDAIMLHKPDVFEACGFARLLGTSGFASFQAKLLALGFTQISQGPHKGAFKHKYFVKDEYYLCHRITGYRKLAAVRLLRTHATTPTAGANAESRIKRSCFRPVVPARPAVKTVSITRVVATIPPASPKQTDQHIATAVAMPVTPPNATKTTVQALKRILPNNGSGSANTNASFPMRLHDMLTVMEQHGYEHVVSWKPHGRCFQVHDRDLFTEIVLPHFRHSSHASFRAQLLAYGFVRINNADSADRGSYYHTLFLRSQKHSCSKMTRRSKTTKSTIRGRPKKTTAGQEEPNFYDMKPMPRTPIKNLEEKASNTGGRSIHQILQEVLQPSPFATKTPTLSLPTFMSNCSPPAVVTPPATTRTTVSFQKILALKEAATKFFPMKEINSTDNHRQTKTNTTMKIPIRNHTNNCIQSTNVNTKELEVALLLTRLDNVTSRYNKAAASNVSAEPTEVATTPRNDIRILPVPTDAPTRSIMVSNDADGTFASPRPTASVFLPKKKPAMEPPGVYFAQ